MRGGGARETGAKGGGTSPYLYLSARLDREEFFSGCQQLQRPEFVLPVSKCAQHVSFTTAQGLRGGQHIRRLYSGGIIIIK